MKAVDRGECAPISFCPEIFIFIEYKSEPCYFSVLVEFPRVCWKPEEAEVIIY